MNDYACILIWDTHTRMGHNIGPYTCTGYPIRVWDVPYAYGPIYAYGAEQPDRFCIFGICGGDHNGPS